MPVTAQQLIALRRSLARYNGDVSRSVLNSLLRGFKSVIESLILPGTENRDGIEVEVGLNPATARAEIRDLIRSRGLAGLMDSGQIDFALRTATEVAQGAGVYVREAADAEVVEIYPAWELLRVYDRDVPRGFRRGPRGTLIPMPGDDWPTRFTAAGAAVGDDAALAVLAATGRMVALKSSELWQALGDGAGGYTDTLGNPFAPFAFNSGYDLNNVGRAECVRLGLLAVGETPRAPQVDVAGLFAPIEEAA